MKCLLQKAILGILGAERPDASALAHFTFGDWRRVYPWLDASGLALYLVHKLISAGMLFSIPERVRTRLLQNREDQQARTQQMLSEFARINHALRQTSLPYAVLKGFALIPDFCPEPALRYQFDFDFLVRCSDIPTFARELATLGYELTHTDETEWHFELSSDRLPSLHSLYKPKPHYAVELHFSGEERAADFILHHRLLEGVRQKSYLSITFPALSPTDMFLMQSLHLLRHISGEWTRISWLLEYRNFVMNNRNNADLWRDVHSRASTFQDAATAIGISTLLTSLAFGKFAPPQLDSWTVNALSPPAKIWINRYGWNVLLADFPGTKLYLLLQRELISDEQTWREMRRARIIPLHLPVPVVHTRNASNSQRMRGCWAKLSFLLFRLRFHVREGFRYWRESRRWARIRSAQCTAPSAKFKRSAAKPVSSTQ